MKTVFLFILLSVIISCEKKVNESSSSNSSSSGGSTNVSPDSSQGGGQSSGQGSNNSGSTSGSSSDSCYSPGVGEQANEYYTVNSIIAHGETHNGASVHWSSATDLSFAVNTYDQNIFLTDSRLKLRVLVLPQPSKGTTDSYGRVCEYARGPYTKLKFRLNVRTKNSTRPFFVRNLSDVPVDGCTEVIEVTNIPMSNDPFVVEISNVQWDYSCTYAYAVNDSNPENYCPYYNVWNPDCFELALQVSTDYTKDFN